LEVYAESFPGIIVCPEGGRGFYTDAREIADSSQQWESAVLELVDLVDSWFSTRAEPCWRAIGGLSMGGYGSMKLALKYPDRFGSVYAHSGLLDIAEAHRTERWPSLPQIFGPSVAASEDCFALSERVQSGEKLPHIAFDCGIDDFLLDHSRGFHRHLKKLGIDHRYAEYPGVHDWRYWDSHLPEALDFHARIWAAQS